MAAPTRPPTEVIRTRLRVTGTVQGVGFRPFVYRHAVALGLAGFVLNDAAGVLIDVEGRPDRIAELTRRLVDDAPPLARVASVVAEGASPSGAASNRASTSPFTAAVSDRMSASSARSPRASMTAMPWSAIVPDTSTTSPTWTRSGPTVRP